MTAGDETNERRKTVVVVVAVGYGNIAPISRSNKAIRRVLLRRMRGRRAENVVPIRVRDGRLEFVDLSQK